MAAIDVLNRIGERLTEQLHHRAASRAMVFLRMIDNEEFPRR